MNANLAPFTNPAAVASYTQDAPKKVPGLADLHRMTTILLGERAPGAADILVVGAGGGLELKAIAQTRPDWRFTGVDPSPAMLDIARQTTALYADRIELLASTVDQVPISRFDGATCLLTLHFLNRIERLHTLREIRLRLKPGGVLVIAHHTAPDGNPERWLARSATFADRTDSDARRSAASAKAMAERLSLLSPDEEEELLREAGFVEPALFYAAFSFRGWAAIAG
ncbi:class I SAM-dependent methyltransferase [Brucella sp. BE17]|uniref:class I SAM-dependent methyltransferase n=1 Tax=Brucella sp. BE17 TaxID=3142977 RepID=UPI0031B9C21D